MKWLSKFNLYKIIKEHHKTFYDAGVSKNGSRVISLPEIIVYYSIPLVITMAGVGLIGYFNISIPLIDKLLNGILTVVSIFAPLLLSTLVLVYDIHTKYDANENNFVFILSKEMFANICFSEIICILIIILILINFIVSCFTLLALIIFLSSLFFITIFMVIKRLFSLIYEK